MPSFQYHPDILARFPTVVGGVMIGAGLRSGVTPPELAALYEAEQKATLERIGSTPLSQLESLTAWRAAFRAFGVDPTQYRSAAEALLRRLTKQGDIPSINMLVDIGNLVSIRYGLPVAILDRRAVQGAITVRFADGSERFTNLGTSEAEHPEPGEVIFADETNLVFARRWCWRQSDQSGAREDTTDVLITVEGHHEAARRDVKAALRDLDGLLRRFTGGIWTQAVLSREQAAI